jgi:hypothetical protein
MWCGGFDEPNRTRTRPPVSSWAGAVRSDSWETCLPEIIVSEVASQLELNWFAYSQKPCEMDFLEDAFWWNSSVSFALCL